MGFLHRLGGDNSSRSDRESRNRRSQGHSAYTETTSSHKGADSSAFGEGLSLRQKIQTLMVCNQIPAPVLLCHMDNFKELGDETARLFQCLAEEQDKVKTNLTEGQQNELKRMKKALIAILRSNGVPM